jgi:hypothetical protein
MISSLLACLKVRLVHQIIIENARRSGQFLRERQNILRIPAGPAIRIWQQALRIIATVECPGSRG